MKRFFLLSLLAVGCAHAPALEQARTETAIAADSVRVIREAVREELLGAVQRPASEFALALKLYGTPKYLGVIDYTGTSTTNHQASTPFNNTGDALCGKTLLLKATTDAHVLAVSTNTGTVTTATGVPIGPTDRVIQTMPASVSGTKCWLAVIRATASGNLSVWELE